MSVDELKQMFGTCTAAEKLKILRHEGTRYTSTIVGYAQLLTKLTLNPPEHQQYIEEITKANQAFWNTPAALTGDGCSD